MKSQLLHIFRNSPMGRENLMQAAYYCEKQFGLSLTVFIPTATRLFVDFKSGSVPIDLDSSYLAFPDSARQHVEETLQQYKTQYRFYIPTEFADNVTPILPTDWAVMSCPRVISEQSSRIGLGHIGPKVRGIVKRAVFPVFMPGTAFKTWNSVSICFGGLAIGCPGGRAGHCHREAGTGAFHRVYAA